MKTEVADAHIRGIPMSDNTIQCRTRHGIWCEEHVLYKIYQSPFDFDATHRDVLCGPHRENIDRFLTTASQTTSTSLWRLTRRYSASLLTKPVSAPGWMPFWMRVFRSGNKEELRRVRCEVTSEKRKGEDGYRTKLEGPLFTLLTLDTTKISGPVLKLPIPWEEYGYPWARHLYHCTSICCLQCLVC